MQIVQVRGVKGTALIPNSVTCEAFECFIQGDDSLILCESHYTQLYNVWTSRERICTGYGRQRKHSEQFIRKCPNPELISRVLNLEKEITSSDYISKICYDFHKQLINQTAVESFREDLILRISKIMSDITKFEDTDEQAWAVNKASLSVASKRSVNHRNEVPSYDALLYHWKRCVWVLHM